MNQAPSPLVTHVGSDGVERTYFEDMTVCEVWIAELGLQEDFTRGELEAAGGRDGAFLTEVVDALEIEGLEGAVLRRPAVPMFRPDVFYAPIHQTARGRRNGVVPAKVSLHFFTAIDGTYQARAWVIHMVRIEGSVVANASVHHRRVAEVGRTDTAGGSHWEVIQIRDRSEVPLPNGSIDWEDRLVLS